MKVPFVHGCGDLRLDEVAAPVAGTGDVVIRPAVVGICGSDLGYLAAGGITGPGEPIPLGHELSGTVETVGADVRGFAAGDRVVVNPLTNYIGNGGPEGGFAERLLVRGVGDNPGALLAMPDAMSFETGALVEPLAVALRAVNRSGAKPGDKVALFGAGPIGLGVTALMRHRGIDDLIVFDPSLLRRERALALGARAALDPRERSVADALAELHGPASAYGLEGPATRVFLDAAGAAGVMDAIVAMAPIGAGITMIAVPKGSGMVSLQTLLARELTIRSSMAYANEFADAMALLADGLDVSGMVTHRFTSDKVDEAFGAAARQDEAIKVLVSYDA